VILDFLWNTDFHESTPVISSQNTENQVPDLAKLYYTFPFIRWYPAAGEELMLDSTILPDVIDLRLIEALMDDARLSQQALGERLGRSPTAIARRQKVLEASGIITGYAATIDASKLGMGTTAHVLVTLENQHGATMDAFEKAIRDSTSVIRCELVSGAADYLITLVIYSLDDFARLHRDELASLPGVARLESSFVLKPIINRTAPPRLLNHQPRLRGQRVGIA
jgi:Lrp/AsnC family transcriptional regulator, leucine-responsive regulatory protein